MSTARVIEPDSVWHLAPEAARRALIEGLIDGTWRRPPRTEYEAAGVTEQLNYQRGRLAAAACIARGVALRGEPSAADAQFALLVARRAGVLE